MAGASQLVARHDQGKAVRDKERSYDFKRRPGLGKVANGAVDRAAAERDRPGLQNTAPRRNSMLVHRVEVRSKGENSINGASGAIEERDQTAK